MRALAAWLLLLGLCGAAGYAQYRWTSGVRAARESLRSVPTDLESREESWGELRLGRPSGAEPVEVPPLRDEGLEEPAASGRLAAEAPLEELSPAERGVEPEDWRPPDFEYLVPEGRVLSKICEDFYGSGRPPIPGRVATYNGLASPDSLRAGFLLRLPPKEVLLPEESGERP